MKTSLPEKSLSRTEITRIAENAGYLWTKGHAEKNVKSKSKFDRSENFNLFDEVKEIEKVVEESENFRTKSLSETSCKNIPFF